MTRERKPKTREPTEGFEVSVGMRFRACWDAAAIYRVVRCSRVEAVILMQGGTIEHEIPLGQLEELIQTGVWREEF